jgi:glutamate carboxypeptidase
MNCSRLSLAPVVVMLAWSGCATAAPLTNMERRIVAAIESRTEPAITLLAETVDVPSASENSAGVRKVGDIYAREFRTLGFET